MSIVIVIRTKKVFIQPRVNNICLNKVCHRKVSKFKIEIIFFLQSHLRTQIDSEKEKTKMGVEVTQVTFDEMKIRLVEKDGEILELKVFKIREYHFFA